MPTYPPLVSLCRGVMSSCNHCQRPHEKNSAKILSSVDPHCHCAETFLCPSIVTAELVLTTLAMSDVLTFLWLAYLYFFKFSLHKHRRQILQAGASHRGIVTRMSIRSTILYQTDRAVGFQCALPCCIYGICITEYIKTGHRLCKGKEGLE
jgi:hypothetical protein